MKPGLLADLLLEVLSPSRSWPAYSCDGWRTRHQKKRRARSANPTRERTRSCSTGACVSLSLKTSQRATRRAACSLNPMSSGSLLRGVETCRRYCLWQPAALEELCLPSETAPPVHSRSLICHRRQPVSGRCSSLRRCSYHAGGLAGDQRRPCAARAALTPLSDMFALGQLFLALNLPIDKRCPILPKLSGIPREVG